MTAPAVAFYAPMKAPGHPVPSGDRQIARLTLRALALAGFAPFVASDLRLFDGAGNAAVQADLTRRAAAEAARLAVALAGGAAAAATDPSADLSRAVPGLTGDPGDALLTAARTPPAPALWFTYHCHYKAPDLIGPALAGRLGIPYVISEPSVSPRRRDGPWAGFAAASDTAIAAADRLFWTTARDRPALEGAGHAAHMVHLPAFVDPGPEVAVRAAGTPLRLLAVAMMRPGDKLESYARIARGLAALDAGTPPAGGWTLDIHGDGPARPAVDALFAPWRDRVTFHGTSSPPAVRRACEAADLMLWPGVGEGVGMVYLEAQAACLPVVAEDHPAQRDLVPEVRVRPDDPGALARGIRAAARDRAALAARARAGVLARHSLDAAARVLAAELGALV